MTAASSDLNAERLPEHFVTLFDDSFLPIGLALYQSLVARARPFKLWVLAIDTEVERHLAQLTLPDLIVIPLASIHSVMRSKAFVTTGRFQRRT